MKNTRKSVTPLIGSIATLLLACTLPQSAQADQIWDGGGAGNNWTDAANWDSNALPDFTQLINFNGAIRLTPNQNNVAPFLVNGIVFTAGAGGFTLNGNPINLTGGGITNSAANAQTIGTMALTLTAANTIDASTANITINATAPIITGGFAMTLQGANTITINSTIDAVATLGSLVINGGAVAGSGTVAINPGGNNLYAGGTAVNNGLVTVAGVATTALGTGTLTIGNGTGAQGTAIVRNLSGGMLSSAQALSIASDGRYDLNGFSEIVGSIASTGATQANSQIFLGAAGALTTGDATNTTFQGIISGAAGTVTKQGTGVWTVTGANSYTGGTTVNAGTLAVGDLNAGGGSGSTVAAAGTGIINVGAAGTLRWDLASGQTEFNNMGLAAGSVVNATPAAGGFQTLAGLIFGAGTLNQNGPGLSILTATNTFVGPVNVLAGSLSVGNASTLAVNNFATAGDTANLVTVNGGVGGSTLRVDLQRNETFANGVTLTGAADRLILASPFAQTVGGAITGLGGVTQGDAANTGATTLTDVGSTYSGGTTITGGTLNLNANNAALGGGAPAVGPLGTGRLTINGGGIGTTTADIGDTKRAIGNLVTLSASFAVSNIVGAPVLAAAPPAGVPNAGVGAPVVNNLTVGFVADGLAMTNTVTLTAPVTMTTNSGSLDFTGAIGGTGGMTFAGNTFTYLGSAGISGLGGILNVGQFDASNTYTGTTVVNGTAAGSLLVLGKTNNAVAIPGDLQIDSGATVRFDSSLPNFVGFAATSNQIAPTANLVVNGALDISGLNQTVNNLTGGGTVQLDDFNGAALNGAGVLTVGSGNFTGVIFDNGHGGRLVKNSTGTLILSGNNTFNGTTAINAGTLQVDGFIGSGNTLVNGLGTLSGSGVLGGNLLNSGVVSPGVSSGSFSPGKLTVNGNYTQGAVGTLVIQVNGKKAGDFDVVAVGGAANLGGTVRVLNTGNVKIKRGEKLTFLTATNGVNGQFANETLAEFGGDTLLKSDIVYKSNSVEITTKLGSFASDIGGLTENQTAVAKQLDKANSAGQADELLDFLSTEEVGKLPADLDKIAPEELTSFFRIGTSLANVQNGNLERRMSDVRAGAEGFSANGYSTGGSRPSSGRDRAYSGGERSSTDGQPNYYSGATAYGPTGEGGREMRAPGQPIPIGVFITGVGEFTNVGDDSTARGYDLTTGGFTLGVDFKLTPNFVFGINAGYARTGADLTGDGRVTVDGAKAGVYATYFTGTGFYVDAAVNGGYNNYDSRRGALQGTAVGSTSGTEINALIGTGYDWRRGDFSIGPVASVQYTHVKVSGFRERGSLAPLNIAGNSGESLRTALGVKTSYDIRPLGTGIVIRPEVRAAWQHEFADSSFALDSRLANGAGNTFTVRGPEIGDDSLLVGAGVAVLWNERTSTYVYYDGEFGRSNSSSNNFSGGVRLTF